MGVYFVSASICFNTDKDIFVLLHKLWTQDVQWSREVTEPTAVDTL